MVLNDQPGLIYDAAPDGRFLMIKDDAASSDGLAATEGKIISVQNWFEELTRLVPVAP